MKKKGDNHSESKARKVILHYPDDTPAGYIEYNGDSSKVYDENDNFLFEVNGIFPPKPKSYSDFSWIDKVLEKGIQDGRKRFILYVASRYLVNIKGLSDEEAIQVLKEFYYKVPTGKIYDSWLKSVINGVKNKGLLPWSLEKISEKDKEMYNEIIKILKS